MSPIVEVLLIVVLLIAALVWVALYFFLVEGWLKRLVGNIFGVTIGKSKLESRRVNAQTKFYVSGWSVAQPKSSGCLFDIFIWIIGGMLRLIFIGVPAGALLLLALYLAYLVTRP
jgi:hypothetical protein